MPHKFKVETVNHVGVSILNRQRAFPFYRDILGLEIIPSMVDSDRIVWMRAEDGTMVHLIEPNQATALGTHYAYQVDDFDAALEAFREAGYFIEGPSERYDGQRCFFVLDPDGNRVEITTASGLKPSNRVADENGYTREP